MVTRNALQVPLQGKTLQATGDVLLRAELLAFIIDPDQAWHPVPFRVDSAAEVTTMPAVLAKRLHLPLTQDPVPGLLVTTSTGTVAGQVRSGVIKIRLFGLEEFEFWFPCFFLGDPDAAPATGEPAFPRTLLGLTGVVDKVRVTLDGSAAEDAPYGHVIVERLAGA